MILPKNFWCYTGSVKKVTTSPFYLSVSGSNRMGMTETKHTILVSM